MSRTTISRRKSKNVFVRKDTLTQPAGWLPVGTGYQVRLFRNAADIPDGEWKLLNHEGNLFTDLDYLRGLEHTAPPQMEFCYCIVRKSGKNMAGYIFQTIHLTADALADVLAPVVKQKCLVIGNMTEWFRRCREEKGLRVLISGNNYVSGEHGVITAKNVNPDVSFNLMPDVIKLMVREFSKPVKISMILVKDYYSSGKSKSHRLLRKKRYHSFAVEPEMILSMRAEWTSFDEYVASMSKKYRNRVKSVLRSSEPLMQHHLTAEEIRLNIDKLFPLYHNMHLKARFRLAALTPDYFIEMKKRYPGKFAVIMYTLKGKPVAFRSFFLNNDQLEAHFIGVDYSLNKELDLYQRILYDFVSDTIKTGRKQLLLGRTAAEIKSTIGAVAHDFTCYIRHRNSIHNQVIRPFIEYLKPTEWTRRNPFRVDA